MKRSLLLFIPALAVFLMACPQKHITSGATPDKPDPNGYVYGSQTNNNTQSGIQSGYDGIPAGTNGSNSNSSANNNTGAITSGSAATGNSSESMSNGNVNNNPDSIPVIGSKPDSVRTRLVVSFISTGGGIDLAAQTRLEKWLSKNPQVKYAQNHWGREGEIDYCFLVLADNETVQNETVGEIKDVIGKSDKVIYKAYVVCKHKHELGLPTLPPAEEVIDTTKATSSDTARVVVSFISKGAGIDLKTKDALDKWLLERNVIYEVKNWGREGELNYCFFLTGMQSRQQDIFVRDLRTFIGTNDMVLVEEWGKCDKRK